MSHPPHPAKKRPVPCPRKKKRLPRYRQLHVLHLTGAGTGSNEGKSTTSEGMDFPEELANPDLVGALVQVGLGYKEYLKTIQSCCTRGWNSVNLTGVVFRGRHLGASVLGIGMPPLAKAKAAAR